VKFEGQAKMADGFLTADTAGRAKMEDGYISTGKLGDASITADKIQDGVITTSKLSATDAPVYRALCRWSGAAVRKTITQPTSGSNLVVASHGLTSGTDVNNVPAGMIAHGSSSDDDALIGTSGIHNQRLYFFRVIDSNTLSVHPTAQDALDNTNAVVCGVINIPSLFLWYATTANVYRRGAGVAPIPDPSNNSSTIGWKVTWLTPDANYTIQFSQEYPVPVSGSSATIQSVAAGSIHLIYTSTPNSSSQNSYHVVAFK
jgi:hypothetical protein